MRRIGALTALALVSGALVAGVGGTAQAADRDIVLTHGHIDLFELTYDDASDQLQLQIKDDTGIHAPGAVYRTPEDVTIAVDDELAALEIPAGLPPSYAFLGEPGDVVYDLPQSQNDQLPWPGWSTERLLGTLPDDVTLASGMPVALSVEVDGPGEVHTFMNGPTGEVINHYIDSSDGGPDVIPVAASAHVHTEWIFTELGEYTLEVTPSASTSTGGTITGPASTYHIRVGDEVPAELGLEVTANKPNATYLYGQGITLDAAPTAATELDHYHWFVKRAGEPAYSISNRSSTSQLKLPTSLVWDGAEVYANLYDDEHRVVASSEPLTLHVSALPEVTELSAQSDKASYAVGDTAQFTSTQNPETGEDHFHWYVKKQGEEFYTYIPGSDQATAELPITADLHGGSVVARLFDHNHAVIAESNPVPLSVGAAQAPVATEVALHGTVAKQPFGAKKPSVMRVKVTAEGGSPGEGTVDVRVGALLIGKDVPVDGTGVATVTAPRTVRVGTHTLTASFTPTDPTAQASIPFTAVGKLIVTKAPAQARIRLKRSVVRPWQRAQLVVRVTLPQSTGIAANGQVVVFDGSRRIAVGTVRNGQVITVALPRLKRGAHRLSVVYRGSTTTAKATSNRTVLTVRR